MASQTVGCEGVQASLESWDLEWWGARAVFHTDGARVRRVLECLGWDVEGNGLPNPRSPAQGVVHHWHLMFLTPWTAEYEPLLMLKMVVDIILQLRLVYGVSKKFTPN